MEQFTIEQFIRETGLTNFNNNKTPESVCEIITQNYKLGHRLPFIKVKVFDCHDRSLTVGGIPSDFLVFYKDRKWFLGDSAVEVLEYVGTYGCGILYLNASIIIKPGNYLNFRYD